MEKLKTRDITFELKKFAKENYLKFDELDFDLKSVSTYLKTKHLDTFASFTKSYRDTYANEKDIIEDRLVIKQVYVIEPYRVNLGSEVLEYDLDLSENFLFPILKILPKTIFPKLSVKELYLYILSEVNKIKAVNQMIIGFRDENIKEDIKILTKKIVSKDFYEPFEISLFNSVEPVISRKSSLKLFFKELKSQIKEVKKDELLLKFVKLKVGTNGFNAQGKWVGAGELNNSILLKYKYDSESVKKEDVDGIVSYYAKKQGFVEINDDVICISNSFSTNEIKRVENSLTYKEKNDVEIRITNDDVTKDSIGEGTKVKSYKIKVDGFIGANSQIEANEVIIGGSTHKSSKIFSKKAEINRHKGELRCQNAKIKLLEGGKVEGTSLHIETALGGEIYGCDVVIDNLKSKVKVYASNSIAIKRVSGEDNFLSIDISKIDVAQKKIDFINQEIHDFKYLLQNAVDHNEVSKISDITQKISNLQSVIDEMYNKIFISYIEVEGVFKAYNTISFIINPEEKLKFENTQNKKYSRFTIKNSEITYKIL